MIGIEGKTSIKLTPKPPAIGGTSNTEMRQAEANHVKQLRRKIAVGIRKTHIYSHLPQQRRSRQNTQQKAKQQTKQVWSKPSRDISNQVSFRQDRKKEATKPTTR